MVTLFVGGCIFGLLIMGLKLWAAYHIFTVGMAWYTLGTVPSFWQFVWCALLAIFIFSKASVTFKNT